jgi:hypothetical protein
VQEKTFHAQKQEMLFRAQMQEMLFRAQRQEFFAHKKSASPAPDHKVSGAGLTCNLQYSV